MRGSKDLPLDAPRPPSLARTYGALSTLYRMAGTDAAPTPVMLTETTNAERELAVLAKDWDAFKATELTALDKQLEAAKLPKIKPELRPRDRGDTGDVE